MGISGFGVFAPVPVFAALAVISLFPARGSLAAPQMEQMTAFEKRCSVCHTLESLRTEMEIMIKQMHQKAGIRMSDAELKQIEKSFPLRPVKEPHRALFKDQCQKCHGLEVVIKAGQTDDQAEIKATIERMSKKKRSEISKRDIDKIHQSMFMLNEIYEKEVE